MFKFFERSPESYMPYAGHFPNRPHVGFLLDGTVFAMLEMGGLKYELEDEEALNTRTDVINEMMVRIADDNVVVYSHLVRHRNIDKPPASAQALHSSLARDIYDTYSKRLLTGLRTNTWYITVMVRPASLIAKKHFRFGAREKVSFKVNQAQLRQLQDVVSMVQGTLSSYRPRLLSVRSEPTGRAGYETQFTELGEALYLIRTGVPTEIAYTDASLGSAIYTQRVICGPRAFDLNIPGLARFGSIITYRNYGNHAFPGYLNTLLSAPYDLVLSQSFYFLLGSASEGRNSLKQQQMSNLGDKAVELTQGLTKAMSDVSAGVVASGMHHLSLAVYEEAPSRSDGDVDRAMARLETSVSNAMKRLAKKGGANPMQEGRLGAENAYFAQLPGVATWRTRPGELDSLSFAAMNSLEGFPSGKKKGYWGPAIARFRTRGGTAWDYVTHVEDVGHSVFLGRTGVGKTALATFLFACLEPVMGENGIRLIIDKDAGSKILVELSGGRYIQLRRGQPSGLAPLRGLSNTPGTHSLLLNTFKGLILRDGRGPVEPEEERGIARGIACQMAMPRHLRSMAGVREFMGYVKNGAGDRFEKWCRGGEMGWLLDNDEHLIDFHSPVQARLYGFDFTELLPKDESLGDDGACAAAAAIIIHQMREMMDGRRIAAFFDECRFYLDTLGAVIEDFSLTGRKNELMVWMAAQEPSHFLNHPLGRSLMGQCQTKFAYPDAGADISAYVDGLKFSEAAAKQVKVGMLVAHEPGIEAETPSAVAPRRFLVWRDEESAICEFDLSPMQEELAILSGRAGTVRLLERIERGTLDNPSERYREFRKRHQQARSSAA